MTRVSDLKETIIKAIANEELESGGEVNELSLNDTLTLEGVDGEMGVYAVTMEVYAVTRDCVCRWGGAKVPFEQLNYDSIEELNEHIKSEYDID